MKIDKLKPKPDYLKIVRPLAEKAGAKAAVNWQNYRRGQEIMKGPSEIVTATDKSTEKMIILGLKKHFPSYSFLAEESGASTADPDYRWIIDPIDGTTNFSIHNPLWTISIALAHKEEIIFGLIYCPILKETFWAIKGRGAFLNGQPLKMNGKNKNSKLVHAFCHGTKKQDLIRAIKYYRVQKLSALDCRQLGSASLELCYVAAGRVDSIAIPGARLWDVAAGALLVKEAGGAVGNFAGQKWRAANGDILACRPDLKKSLLSILTRI